MDSSNFNKWLLKDDMEDPETISSLGNEFHICTIQLEI